MASCPESIKAGSSQSCHERGCGPGHTHMLCFRVPRTISLLLPVLLVVSSVCPIHRSRPQMPTALHVEQAFITCHLGSRSSPRARGAWGSWVGKHSRGRSNSLWSLLPHGSPPGSLCAFHEISGLRKSHFLCQLHCRGNGGTGPRSSRPPVPSPGIRSRRLVRGWGNLIL